jgi:hypothetical protein
MAVADDNLIATEDLRIRDVPLPDAELQVLEQFCLTVDAYEGERFSVDHLLRQAERLEARGLENATINELRTTAFIRQREYRWKTDQGQQEPQLARKIRETIREIRRRLEVES